LEDFAVNDNDVLQEATHFSRDQLPLKIALVVDVSGSIQPYMLELGNRPLPRRRALNMLRPAPESTFRIRTAGGPLAFG